MVLGYGRCILYHNNGDGTFRDVTAHAGVANEGKWSSSAAWFDFDNDGLLDLNIYVRCTRTRVPVLQSLRAVSKRGSDSAFSINNGLVFGLGWSFGEPQVSEEQSKFLCFSAAAKGRSRRRRNLDKSAARSGAQARVAIRQWLIVRFAI